MTNKKYLALVVIVVSLIAVGVGISILLSLLRSEPKDVSGNSPVDICRDFLEKIDAGLYEESLQLWTPGSFEYGAMSYEQLVKLYKQADSYELTYVGEGKIERLFEIEYVGRKENGELVLQNWFFVRLNSRNRWELVWGPGESARRRETGIR